MDLHLNFLGTGSSAPTLERSTPALVVARGPERILVDCGEGTQRQMLAAIGGVAAIPTILLTHHHSDHYLGLPGLLKTWAGQDRTEPVTILGPPGTYQLVRGMAGIIGETGYPVVIREPEPGEPIRYDGFALEPVRTRHVVFSYGWVLQEDPRPPELDARRARALGVPDGPLRGALARGESVLLPDGRRVDGRELLGPPRPGRRVVVSGDTLPCAAVAEAAHGADLLVHEATFLDADRDLAVHGGHSTAAQAARLAADAGVRALCLNHLSSRYRDAQVRAEAEAVFPGTIVPRDWDAVAVPMPEREPPHLVPRGARA